MSQSGRLWYGQSARSGGTRGAKAEEGLQILMKEFKPCGWEKMLGYAKETNEPSMFGVKVPENSR